MGNGQTVNLSLDPVLQLAALRDLPGTLSLAERGELVQQTIVLLENFYAHLPLKEAMLAVAPVQRARLLMEDLGSYPSELSFLQELLSLFISLRDLHTNFVTPAPWNQLTAFLPFIVESYCEADDRPRYVVSKISPLVDLGPDFVPGVEVTHWNGVPMPRMVFELSRRTAGANPAARQRRALYGLTVRSLSYELPPEEDWVVLTFLRSGALAEIRYPWLVSRKLAMPASPDVRSAVAPGSTYLGVDSQSVEIQRTRKRLLRPDDLHREQQLLDLRPAALSARPPGTPGEELAADPLFPQNLSYRTVRTTSGEFGLLRIWNFEVSDVEGFVREVARVVRLLPPEGLIIDVRGNPGGTIPAGERLLQLFSPGPVEPAPVQFRSTAMNRRMALAYPFLSPWRQSLNLAVNTGSIFSQGFPLTTYEEANGIGRVYPGKVVVVIDAMCYSTCCFFAAGIQDNGIGIVLGIDETTGAGGANVWTQELLRQLWAPDPGSPMRPLPGGASMRVAVRRSTRVGPNRDIPLEGLGVHADQLHRLTRDDLLHDNVDLLNRAGELLRAGIQGAAATGSGFTPRPQAPPRGGADEGMGSVPETAAEGGEARVERAEGNAEGAPPAPKRPGKSGSGGSPARKRKGSGGGK